MRRLTLILSDLYLPEEAGREVSVPHALALPNFDWLLRFAEGARIEEWRHWLATELGRVDLATLPVATLAAQEILSCDEAATAWLATPVRLEARLDHVRMLERGLPSLAVAEREEWREEFARAFAPFALHDAGPRGFLLTGLSPADVATVDPARVLDSDIAKALPSGIAARELRRLSAEIEMWMHAAPGNVTGTGVPRLSSLWLWGGGMRSLASSAAASTAGAATPGFHGDDPVLMGLSRATTGALPAAVPSGFDGLRDAPEHVVVELTPVNGAPGHALPSLDTHWFAPARAALSAGTLTALDIVANDRWFRIAARPGWRIWRRRRSWLEQLR